MVGALLQALHSLTPTHRKMVRVLAEAQEQNHIGLAASRAVQQVRLAVHVTSMPTFYSHVAEPSSHHLMVEPRPGAPAGDEGGRAHRSGNATDSADC